MFRRVLKEIEEETPETCTRVKGVSGGKERGRRAMRCGGVAQMPRGGEPYPSSTDALAGWKEHKREPRSNL